MKITKEQRQMLDMVKACTPEGLALREEISKETGKAPSTIDQQARYRPAQLFNSAAALRVMKEHFKKATA